MGGSCHLSVEFPSIRSALDESVDTATNVPSESDIILPEAQAACCEAYQAFYTTVLAGDGTQPTMPSAECMVEHHVQVSQGGQACEGTPCAVADSTWYGLTNECCEAKSNGEDLPEVCQTGPICEDRTTNLAAPAPAPASPAPASPAPASPAP